MALRVPLVPSGTQPLTMGADKQSQTPGHKTLSFPGMSPHQGCSVALPWHRHRSCFPIYGSCKCQDLRLCPSPGSPVQADPWHMDSAQVTALISPTATNAKGPQTHEHPLWALSCGHHNQHCQEARTVPRSAAVWVPAMGQAASENPQKARALPTSHEEHLGTEEPPLQVSLEPQSSTTSCLPSGCPCSAPSAVLTHR